MDVFLAYCKRQHQKQRIIVLLIICILMMILYVLWGPKVINFMSGAKDFNEIDFQLSEESQHFFSLKNLENQYAKGELTWLSAGFADTVKGKETIGIYYLYQMDDGKYMILYADKSTIHDTEKLYYNTISENPETMTVTIEGGFEKLDDEVLQYAFEYLHEVDPVLYPDVSAIEDVIMPYVFVSNHMGGSSLIFVQMTFYCYVGCILLFIILFILDFKFISINPTIRNVQKLSEEHQKIVDKEFKSSRKIQHFAIGNQLLFYHFFLQYKVFDYQDIIWMYKEKSKFDILYPYNLWIYLKDGSRHRLVLENDVKKGQKIIDLIHSKNKNMLFGYQAQLCDKYKRTNEDFMKLISEMKSVKEEEKSDEKS